MKKQKILNALLQDLKKYGSQSAWDMESDARFADIIDHPDKENIRLCATGASPRPVRKNYLDQSGITKTRLRYLRELVKLGLVEVSWRGMGFGSWYELGVRRDRVYELREVKNG